MDQRPLFGAGSKATNQPQNQAVGETSPVPQGARSAAPVQVQAAPQSAPQSAPIQPPPLPVEALPKTQPGAQPSAPVIPPQQPIPDLQTGSAEDRKETRKRALKGGMIVFPGQTMTSYACKVRNESRGGVMLLLTDSIPVPPEFYLIRDADPGHKIPCRVAWRGIGRVGVQFIAELTNP